jgi:acetyl-CoA carboxylase carboxyl transferase subunit alpha
MKNLNLVDEVLTEPLNGAHRSQEEMFDTVKKYIKATITELEKINPTERINQRIDKFCAMGVWK